MEVELGGQLQQRAVPDRLRLVIAAGGHGLHIVEYEHPGHEAQRVEARHQPTEQRLLTHLLGEHHPRPTAVFKATRQEIARHGLLLGERKVADLTPVDLQVFARQALETNRHVGDGLFVRQRRAPTRGRLPIDGLAQCAGDRVLTAAQLARDLAQAFPALVQQVDGTAFHAS